MCDEMQLADMGSRKGLNRRQFTALGAVGALAACAPVNDAEAQGGLAESDVTFAAPGGKMDAFFVHPADGAHPAVIIWPDVAGLRDSFKMMARRLAGSGYSVIVLNPYYRDAPAPQFADFEAYRNGGGDKVAPWRTKNDAAGVMETARAVVAWLDGQDAVDTARGIGTQGYCMGGPYTVWTAVAVPARVKAAASFHGGGLVADDNPNSPHRLLGDTQAQFLFAIARNDDARSPTDKDVLAQSAQAAGRPAEVEVYDGDHGWTVPDSPSYAEPAAEKAWGRLLATYSAAL